MEENQEENGNGNLVVAKETSAAADVGKIADESISTGESAYVAETLEEATSVESEVVPDIQEDADN